MQQLKGKARNIIGNTKWQSNMLAEAAGVASMATGFGAGKANGARHPLERALAWMTEASMPQRAVVGGEKGRCRASRGS
jgi:hypothetical protein